MTKICPKCQGLTEKDGTWCSCGWRAKPVGNILENRKEHYCEFNDYGQSCQKVGFLSQSTNGSGPWYCRQHLARIMGWPQLEAMSVERDAPIEPMSEVDKRVNRLVPRREGESVHEWSMRCRAHVMQKVKRLAERMREPGEDLEEAA